MMMLELIAVATMQQLHLFYSRATGGLDRWESLEFSLFPVFLKKPWTWVDRLLRQAVTSHMSHEAKPTRTERKLGLSVTCIVMLCLPPLKLKY